MKNDEEMILPCPFCGQQGRSFWRWEGRDESKRLWMAGCTNQACHIYATTGTTPVFNDEDSAIAAWNTRSPSPAEAGTDDWKDISSAPKDGSTILGYYPGKLAGDIMPIYWSAGDGGAWACPVDFHIVYDDPICWMPLPQAPPQERTNNDD